MKRFFVRSKDVSGGKLFIKGAQAHHLKNVLRLKKGDKVIAFDEKGAEYKGKISILTPALVTVGIDNSFQAAGFKAACDITLAQAVPKSGKMDYVVQKATELGVNRIIPVLTKRSVSMADKKRLASKAGRWQRIALEACKQSARCGIPLIEEAMPLKDALSQLACCELRLFFCVDEAASGLRDILNRYEKPPKTAAIFIGPEGDFTSDEAELAKKNGFLTSSLGERILRTETAGLYVLAILDYAFSS